MTPRPRTLKAALFATTLIAALLSGCSRGEPERPPTNTVQEAEDAPVVTAPTPSPEPTPRIAAPDATVQSNAIDELGDEPAAPDQQMLDDAAAAGMTARTSRTDPPAQEAPAEVVEEK